MNVRDELTAAETERLEILEDRINLAADPYWRSPLTDTGVWETICPICGRTELETHITPTFCCEVRKTRRKQS